MIFKEKDKMYKMLVRPILPYGSESWPLKNER
jgi:hypothetical protein